MYSYIHSLMEYDNFKSSKYLKTLIIINKNKTISSYMILYLKEKKYNMKSFKEIFKEWTKFNKEPNCKCSFCKKEIYVKPSRLKRVKNGICCSKECTYKLKSE